ncbi:hypothetical protein UXO69_05200 [Enterobacter hormaechei]
MALARVCNPFIGCFLSSDVLLFVLQNYHLVTAIGIGFLVEFQTQIFSGGWTVILSRKKSPVVVSGMFSDSAKLIDAGSKTDISALFVPSVI